jgi:pyrroline-5-carboxylate reductase
MPSGNLSGSLNILRVNQTCKLGKFPQQVTSPGGTTTAALAVMMENGRLEGVIKDAVRASYDRGVELGA